MIILRLFFLVVLERVTKYHEVASCTPRRCAICSLSKLERRSRWMCSTCKVALCIIKNRKCFDEYHRRFNGGSLWTRRETEKEKWLCRVSFIRISWRKLKGWEGKGKTKTSQVSLHSTIEFLSLSGMAYLVRIRRRARVPITKWRNKRFPLTAFATRSFVSFANYYYYCYHRHLYYFLSRPNVAIYPVRDIGFLPVNGHYNEPFFGSRTPKLADNFPGPESLRLGLLS